MSGPGMCGCCGQIVRFWCDHCNYGKGSPTCECGCDTPARPLSIQEGRARCEAAKQAHPGAFLPNGGWYAQERVQLALKEKHAGNYHCLYCGRYWKSEARMRRCEVACEAACKEAEGPDPLNDWWAP